MARPSPAARRPSAGARPRRCGFSLAADTHRPRFFTWSAEASNWTVTVFRNSLEYAAIAAGGKARTRRTRMSVLDHPTAQQLLREARIPTTALAGWPRRL